MHLVHKKVGEFSDLLIGWGHIPGQDTGILCNNSTSVTNVTAQQGATHRAAAAAEKQDQGEHRLPRRLNSYDLIPDGASIMYTYEG
jgi:hypothetical protein